MSKNQKNVIKWIIGVIALFIGAFCIVELDPDPMVVDKEPLVGIGWLIGGLVISCAIGGWYVKQVFFGEIKDNTNEEETKPEARS